MASYESQIRKAKVLIRRPLVTLSPPTPAPQTNVQYTPAYILYLNRDLAFADNAIVKYDLLAGTTSSTYRPGGMFPNQLESGIENKTGDLQIYGFETPGRMRTFDESLNLLSGPGSNGGYSNQVYNDELSAVGFSLSHTGLSMTLRNNYTTGVFQTYGWSALPYVPEPTEWSHSENSNSDCSLYVANDKIYVFGNTFIYQFMLNTAAIWVFNLDGGRLNIIRPFGIVPLTWSRAICVDDRYIYLAGQTITGVRVLNLSGNFITDIPMPDLSADHYAACIKTSAHFIYVLWNGTYTSCLSIYNKSDFSIYNFPSIPDGPYDLPSPTTSFCLSPSNPEYATSIATSYTTLPVTSATLSNAAGSYTFAVNISASTAAWTASVAVGSDWITLTTASGTGNGTVGYSVSANYGSNRSGRIVVNGLTFDVLQLSNTNVPPQPTPPPSPTPPPTPPPTPDTTAPTFSGCASATAISASEITFTWAAATDAVTAQANIVYLGYVAAQSGAENYSIPTFTSTAGVTSYTLTGLTQNTTYYVIVRAKDEAGNIDTNVVERSATTQSSVIPPPPGVTPLTSDVAIRLESLGAFQYKIYSAVHSGSTRILFATATRDWVNKVNMVVSYNHAPTVSDYNAILAFIQRTGITETGSTGVVIGSYRFWWGIEGLNQAVGIWGVDALAGTYYVMAFNSTGSTASYDIQYSDL